MRKFFLICITLVGVLSCRQNESNDLSFNETGKVSTVSSAKFSNLTEKELVAQLVLDDDFITYGKSLFDFYESMPTKAIFLKDFDVSAWEQEGIPYLAGLTGYTDSEIENRFYKIAGDLKALQDKYPQLVYDGKNEAFINNVIDEASDQLNNSGAWAKNGCAECRKIHRPRVFASAIIGGATGFLTGGIMGGASGAFTGLIQSLSAAGDCFDAAGC